jgi:hypothetical protein
MKLAIVKSGCFDGGGVSRVIESWARMLRDAGHDVTVVSQADSQARDLDLPGVRTLLSASREAAGRRNPLFAEAHAVARMIEDLHRRGEIDLVGRVAKRGAAPGK